MNEVIITVESNCNVYKQCLGNPETSVSVCIAVSVLGFCTRVGCAYMIAVLMKIAYAVTRVSHCCTQHVFRMFFVCNTHSVIKLS